jgi:hypothetical protein
VAAASGPLPQPPHRAFRAATPQRPLRRRSGTSGGSRAAKPRACSVHGLQAPNMSTSLYRWRAFASSCHAAARGVRGCAITRGLPFQHALIVKTRLSQEDGAQT